jgi:hypothetical protein
VPLTSLFRSGKVELHAITTNDKWALTVQIKDWKGFGHRHFFHYGKIRPGYVDVDSRSSNESFSTAFPPPPSFPVHPAGFVTFNRRGTAVSVDAAPGNLDYSNSILIHGSMRCVKRP